MKALVIGYNRISKECEKKIKTQYDYIFFKDINPFKNKLFLKKLKIAQGIIGMGFPANRTLLSLAKNLKIICNIGTGYDNLDLKEMKKRNVLGTNTPHVLNNTTADLVFGLLMASARRIPEMHIMTQKGLWQGTLDRGTFGVDVYKKN